MNKFFCVILALISFDVQALQTKFLLLLGPSGVGKSTLIKHLKKIDDRFVYIKPFTTRELREGEKDKVHVSLEEIKQMELDGKLLTINCIYGIYYATPKKEIDDALQNGKFPILDWPVEKMAIMQEVYKDLLCSVYVQPEDIQELKRRLMLDNRDKNGSRLAQGIAEIDNYIAGYFDSLIDLKVVNNRGKDYETAQIIYQFYSNAIQ